MPRVAEIEQVCDWGVRLHWVQRVYVRVCVCACVCARVCVMSL